MTPENFQLLLSTLFWLTGWGCFFAGIVKLSRAYKMKGGPDFGARRKDGLRYLLTGGMLLGVLLVLLVHDTVLMLNTRTHMPPAGATAPGFALPNQEGKAVSLASFRGKWVVLYFYPADFTSGCSLEAHNFQEDIEKYVAKNATIVGVSVDAPGSHKSFCAKEGLNFTLLADTERRVITLYGSTMNLGGTTLAARNTFLIDPKGIIRKTYASVSPAKHSEEVLGDLERLEK